MKILFSLLLAVLLLSLNLFSQPSLELVWKKNVFPTQIEFAKFSKDGNYIYCAIGNNIQVMDAKTGEFVSSFENQNVAAIYDLDISLNGNYIVTHDGGGSINIWDTRIKKAIKHISFVSQAGNDGALAVSISPDERFLIIYVMESITWNQFKGYIIKYDFISEKEIVKLQLDKDTRKIHISHDGKFFVTGSSLKNIDNTFNDQLILWDAVTMQQIKVLENLNIGGAYEGYKSLKFSLDDLFLTTVRRNFTALVINLTNGEIYLNTDKSRLCRNMELLPGNEDYLIYYESWFNDYEFEFYHLSNIVESYNYKCSLIECTGTSEIWNVFAGSPLNNYYFFKKGTTDIFPEKGDLQFVISNTNNNIVIKNKEDIFVRFEIIITDLNGKEFLRKIIDEDNQSNEFSINHYLPSGIYLCKIIVDSRSFYQKIEIVR